MRLMHSKEWLIQAELQQVKDNWIQDVAAFYNIASEIKLQSKEQDIERGNLLDK